jgi:Predicted signal transduction protein with a C-terminal ATPase domain
MRRFSKNLKSKFVILMILLTVIPILTMGFTSNMVARRIISEKSNNLSLKTLEKMAQYASGDLQYVSEMVYNISQNKLVQEAMSQKTDNLQKREAMHQKLKKELMLYNSVNRIKYPLQYMMLSNQGELYTSYFYSPYGEYEKVTDYIHKEKWYPSMASQVYDELWVGLRNNLLLKNGEDQIYFASNVTDGNYNYGVVIIGFSQSYFSKTMNNLKFSSNSSIFFIDDTENSILPGSDSNRLYDKFSGQELSAIKYEQPTRMEVDGLTYIAMKMKIQLISVNRSWTLYMITPVSDIYRDINLINYITIGLILFVLLSVLILIVVMNRWLVLPIIGLSKLMNSVKKGDLSVRARETQNDEIGQLESGFNQMVAKLQENIEKIKQEEEQKRKLEIDVLQAQINPHFIRNTLNTVRWMAELKKATGISHAITSFIRLMDYSFRDQCTMVTLEDEIKYLNEYIYLQRLRYQNKFNFEVDVEENLKYQKILKLILQPIVENSILHGLESKNGFGSLKIRVYSEEAIYLMVSIEDDGVGIPPDRIQDILEGNIQRTNRGNSHIGLSNVQERIRLNFGDKYGMIINSEIDKGTQVIIRLPLIGGNQHESIDD